MACSMNRSDVSKTVIGVIKSKNEGKTVTEATQFWANLGEGRDARQRYHGPVQEKLKKGCELTKVKREDWRGYIRVSDAIDKIFADLEAQMATS